MSSCATTCIRSASWNPHDLLRLTMSLATRAGTAGMRVAYSARMTLPRNSRFWMSLVLAAAGLCGCAPSHADDLDTESDGGVADMLLDAATTPPIPRDASVPCGEINCEDDEFCLNLFCSGTDAGPCRVGEDGGQQGNCPDLHCVPIASCTAELADAFFGNYTCDACGSGPGGAPASIDPSTGAGRCSCQ